jgi:hypothetical protein
MVTHSEIEQTQDVKIRNRGPPESDFGDGKAKDPIRCNGQGRKGCGMHLTVRKVNGKTTIRLQFGQLAITVEFPL